jgi:HEAT repeat protein
LSHPVLARLASADPRERAAACRDAAQDPAAVVLVDALAAALGDPEVEVARAASDALARLGRDHDVTRALREALHSERSGRRWHAARTLARLEPPAPKLLPAAVEALGSSDSGVRWEAARLLVDTGRLHGEVLPLLLGLARGGEDRLRRAMALHALRELAPDDPRSAAALLAACADPERSVRRAALTAVAGLLAPPPEVATRLAELAASDPDAACRRLAGAALEKLRSAAELAGAALEKLQSGAEPS